MFKARLKVQIEDIVQEELWKVIKDKLIINMRNTKAINTDELNKRLEELNQQMHAIKEKRNKLLKMGWRGPEEPFTEAMQSIQSEIQLKKREIDNQ